MIKRAAAMRQVDNELMRGGLGTVHVSYFAEAEEVYNAGRTFAVITLPPGGSIGYHQHVGEFEIFFILKGDATLRDNDETFTLYPGDSHVCYDGGYHGIANDTATPVELVALVINHESRA